MGKLHLVLVVVIMFSLYRPSTAKSLGNFKSYRQITDKEVLIESTKGAFILISAYNHYALGVTVIHEDRVLELSSPNRIDLNNDLNGSIYVEELDELMQITTSINDGVAIKIEKKPLHFSYIDKTTNTILFEELYGVKFKNKEDDIAFSLSDDEEIKLLANDEITTFSTSIQYGDRLTFDKMNELIFPNNEICLLSSKGYAVIFNAEQRHQIELTKPNQVKITKPANENNEFNYLLVFGPNCPTLIDKYAFHNVADDKQISAK